MLGAWAAPGDEDFSGKAELAGFGEAWGFGYVGDDYGDLSVFEASIAN